MMTIMEASAGAGKTYNLAKTYIRILLESDDPVKYRHILAVTFTNKATDEMKRRILKELHVLATEPSKSPYLKDFVTRLGISADKISRKAQDCLCRILHDYGAFAVSTIDRFFQQTLKAFSREIGQFASYQVELDKDSLVAEAVDRVLDGLSESEGTLLKWLTDNAIAQIEEQGRFRLEESLGAIARSLKSDRLREPLAAQGQGVEALFSRENLLRIKAVCDEVTGDFEKEVSARARQVVDVLAAHDLGVDDLRGRTFRALLSYLDLPRGQAVSKPTAAFLRDACDSSAWFSRANQRFLPLVEADLLPAFTAFCDQFDRPFKVYNTARLVKGQLYGLGIARELEEQFAALLKEKNVLSLDDSNTLLKDIIDGSDAPFVYEKLGVRFENFLLDEFQDTSVIQWENFRPLLENSDGGGFDNLVVGDVKQSIYRWRGSDWRLLSRSLPAEFPVHEEAPLEGNHRTLSAIVKFNNGLFADLSRKLGLDELYARVEQLVCIDDPAPGSVDVVFKETAEEEMDEIVATIRDLTGKGAHCRDIAVLVRGNAEGGAVALRLIAEGIPVVSDDSLKVRSSRIVRLAVSALSLVDNPPREDGRVGVEGYEAFAAGVRVPESYDSLPMLAEQILHSILAADPEAAEGETPYIQSFMDYLQDWVRLNGNDLPAFLAQWAEENPSISSPATGDSVRIMTIHKSKGLEFPYVIFPFVENIPLFKPSGRDDVGDWCHPRVEGTELEGRLDGLFNIHYKTDLSETLFAENLETERQLQLVDNLNVFYVAMTRPQYGLKVISAPKPCGGETMHKYLLEYTGGDVSLGELYDFASIPRKDRGGDFPMEYPSWPLSDAAGESRLRTGGDASDFFGEDGSVGAQASPRLLGNACHGILALVITESDLPAAVEGALRRGEIRAEERDAVLSFLRGKIASVRHLGWFSAGEVRNEGDIVAHDGSVYRPDRVILDGQRAVVVDYKFGERRESYRYQVLRYMRLLRELGYEEVKGYLWYVAEEGEGSIVPV